MMTDIIATGAIDTLIFDMDGVVTTEEKYWTCVRLTLWELITETIGLAEAYPDAVHDPAAQLIVASDDLIYTLKGRAVNSNWDIAYILACIDLAALCDRSGNYPAASNSAPIQIDTVSALYALVRREMNAKVDLQQAIDRFLNGATAGTTGHDLIRAAYDYLRDVLFRCAVANADAVIAPDGALWWDLHARFQRWYSGEALIGRNVPPLIDGTVLLPEVLHAVLTSLTEQGYRLGIATGRPRDELDDALREFDLLRYFDPARIVTLDVIRHAEAALGVSGLSKPHPYSLLKAIDPAGAEASFLNPLTWAQPRRNAAMIGDSTADVQMAHASGTHAIGVLTGVRGQSAQAIRRAILIQNGAEVILPDITFVSAYLSEWARSRL